MFTLKEKTEINTNTMAGRYSEVIKSLQGNFGPRLKTVVLFGSRARGGHGISSDHDIFIIVEGLPEDPIERLKEVRPAVYNAPFKINTIAKTPEEVEMNLSPLLLEICVDGIILFGRGYFEPYRKNAVKGLKKSGLIKYRVGKEWYWRFKDLKPKNWELTWKGFYELSG